MNCLKCGAQLKEEDKFCRGCGSPCETQNSRTLPEMSIVYGTEVNSQLQDTVSQNCVNDEDLVRAYIGKNAEKIMEGNFSLQIFFLGIIYSLYRKMYLFSILWFISILIFSVIFPMFLPIFTTVTNVITSINFNRMYLRHVIGKVQKIKIKNQNASDVELLLICAQKGGTNIAISIIVIIVFWLIVFFNILSATPEDIYYGNSNNNNIYRI